MNLKEDIKPITYLKNHTAEMVRNIFEDGHSVVITQNGEAKVVVMDVETYSHWRNAMAMLKMLVQAEADVESGRIISQDEAFKRAELKVRKAIGDE